MDLQGLRTALLVIDMQNGFCHAEGSLAKAGRSVARLAAPIPACRRLIEQARTVKMPVIYTRAVHDPDFAGVSPKFRERETFPEIVKLGFVVKGSWDAEVIDDLRPGPADHVLDKTTFSAFISSGIDVLLTALQIRNLIVCGVATPICVESTVRDACQHNYRVFVVSDATADMDPQDHEAALRIMQRNFAWVVTTDEAVAALGGTVRRAA
jgi:ureidoacrylate peracid hydrolase